ncbi:hypothetical protein [Morganella morganii]|uniref:hypothetical protein n=1 Tax=Morganella morganii TaxID=582 RepID=UPI001C43981B|nr:hypothetical protein [Morganella morganii]QXO61583.1 hypothetical protein JC826_19580 [Morganella morganii]QXO69056.1 hypothetical protein JC792_19345 [Morganella morganii]
MTIKNDNPCHFFLVTLNYLRNGSIGFAASLVSNDRPQGQVVIDFDARRMVINDFIKRNPDHVNPVIMSVSYLGYEKPSVMLGKSGEIQ